MYVFPFSFWKYNNICLSKKHIITIITSYKWRDCKIYAENIKLPYVTRPRLRRFDGMQEFLSEILQARLDFS